MTTTRPDFLRAVPKSKGTAVIMRAGYPTDALWQATVDKAVSCGLTVQAIDADGASTWLGVPGET